MTGTAVAGIVGEVREVWEGYVEGVLSKEDGGEGRWCYVPVRNILDCVFDDSGR